MPFKKGDLNNPSFKQKRKKTLVAAKKISRNTYSPWLRMTALERMASGILSKTVLAQSGMRVKNALKRWKDMVQVSRDVTPLKRSGVRPRKVKKTLSRRKSFGETYRRRPLCQHRGISMSTFEQICYWNQFKNCLLTTVQQSRWEV